MVRFTADLLCSDLIKSEAPDPYGSLESVKGVLGGAW